MARREIDDWFWKVGHDLQRMSEEMYRSGPSIAARKFWEPRIDVIEDSANILIKAELAGIKGEDIQLLYISERHSVLLKGFRKEEDYPDVNRTGIYQLEIYYGDFEREVKLPEIAVEPGGIRAHYRNGFLIIVVPKATNDADKGPAKQ